MHSTELECLMAAFVLQASISNCRAIYPKYTPGKYGMASDEHNADSQGHCQVIVGKSFIQINLHIAW